MVCLSAWKVITSVNGQDVVEASRIHTGEKPIQQRSRRHSPVHALQSQHRHNLSVPTNHCLCPPTTICAHQPLSVPTNHASFLRGGFQNATPALNPDVHAQQPLSNHTTLEVGNSAQLCCCCRCDEAAVSWSARESEDGFRPDVDGYMGHSADGAREIGGIFHQY